MPIIPSTDMKSNRILFFTIILNLLQPQTMQLTLYSKVLIILRKFLIDDLCIFAEGDLFALAYFIQKGWIISFLLRELSVFLSNRLDFISYDEI